MIDVNAIFGIISILLISIGSIPYALDIHKKKIKPHVLSWLGWSFITAIGASAMMASGSSWATSIVWGNTLVCLFIVIYSISKRVGVWSTSIFDFAFFGLGMIGLILWQTLDAPLLAIICAIVADLSFGIPTITKTYNDPNSETRLPWIFNTLSGVFSVFAIESFVFYDAAYPIYLLIYDLTVLLFVLKVFSKKMKIRT